MPNSPEKMPRIAYFTNAYPSASHTFIRREICGLEAVGYDIVRIAIRLGENFVDPADLEEAKKTTALLGGSKLVLVLSALAYLCLHPLAAIKALRATLQMHQRSERGLLRHVAYLIEAVRLLQLACQHRVQHVHVHFGSNPATVARIAYLLGGPTYSMTIHGPDEFDAAIGHSLGDKIGDARFVVAITDYCASQLMRWCPYDQWPKIQRVHCTVPEEWFEEWSPIPDDSRQLVCVGRLSGQKGQLLLLDAFRSVLDQGIAGHLVLVGGGELADVITQRIKALDLASHVTMAGWQSEAQVREHLRASRALVLSSFAEGLPMVIMESMAMHRPVVVTYITGIPELVRGDEHGWKVTPGNIEALANGMVAALTAPVAQLNAMGDACAQQVHQRHALAGQIARLDALFRKHVGQAQ